MDLQTVQDVRLGRAGLRGRSFLLGNKRAFSLSLPAASGTTEVGLHSHKWFGAYLYGRKFLEAQVVRARVEDERLLSRWVQTGFTMGLTSARREYEVDGRPCSEEFFVPDGVQGFACTLSGDAEFTVEPEFDLRFYRALNHSTAGYVAEPLENGVLVSAPLPSGRYDDLTETFLPDDEQDGETRLYAAVEVVSDGGWSELLPAQARSRRKMFHKDRHRQRRLAATSAEAADHAPLWNESSSRVYAPVRLHLRAHGTVVYGFGATREEALDQVSALRDNLLGYQVQKAETTRATIEHARLETGSERVDRAYAQVLTRLMDALVARNATPEDTVLDRPATMILAGNQYFHDSWKRDENIALGFLLTLGFYDLARDVIRDTWQLQDESTGRLPQRIRAGEEPPYHSSDGTLWALLRLYQYWRYSGDDSLLYEKLPLVERFFHRSLARTINGMLPSGRSTQDYLWETWMDTPHTPRDGFPIEIQVLWISALRSYRPVFASRDPRLAGAMEWAEEVAWQALQRFNVRGMPADSIDSYGQVRDLITPNPYFCFGVGLDLGPEVESTMRAIGRRQLAGRQGIATLSPEDWARVFPPEFLGDRRNVRGRRMQSVGKFNYHRGVEWNWLSRFFVEAELKYGEPDIAFRTYLRSQVDAVLNRSGIGGISELHDLSGARGPEFQAWSMSSFLEALQAFAGVRVDVPDRRITVRPQLPAGWPGLRVRKWYGSTPIDVDYSRKQDTHHLHVSFPWGEAPEAELELGLVLAGREVADAMDVSLDGLPHSPVVHMEAIPGSDRSRITVSVPAAVEARVKLVARRSNARLPRTA